LVTCDREASPELILIEGQSALRNPSGPCGAELLLSAGARAVVLQHAPRRRWFEGWEALGLEIPDLASEVDLIRRYGADVLAVTLNDEHVPAEARDAVAAEAAAAAGVPALWPLYDDLSPLVQRLREHAARNGRAAKP
jgi:uncharacterized NAD-dependent epimerase/dehydratase family protein